MPISCIRNDRRLTVAITGEVDHHSAGTMMRELDRQIDLTAPRSLVLDLSGVTFMDSSGIAVILRAHRQISLHGGALRVCSVPTQPRKVLDAAGLGRIIPIE